MSDKSNKVDDIWESISYPSTILVDDDIRRLGQAGQLIVDNFSKDQIRQTCYNLRVGTSAFSWSRRESIEIKPEVPLVIKPRETINVNTLEKIILPSFVAARIYSRVGLVSGGMSHTSAYADPGFEGCLRISIVNHGNRTIVLRHRDGFCKIEFVKLGRSVITPYLGKLNNPKAKTPITIEMYDPRPISYEEISSSEYLGKEALFHGEPFDALFEIVKHHQNKIDELPNTLRKQIHSMSKKLMWDELQKQISKKVIIRSAIFGAIFGAFTSAILALLISVPDILTRLLKFFGIK